MHESDGKLTTADFIFFPVLLLIFLGGAFMAYRGPGGHDLGSADGLGLLIGWGLTLAFYSFLYRDNVIYKVAENLYVGVGLGYLVVISWFQYIKGPLYEPLVKYWVREDVPGRPDYWLIVPLVLGVFLLARFIKPLAWLSRWSFAFIVGFGSGVAIPTYIQANVLKQLQFTLNQPIAFSSGPETIQAINLLVMIVGVISVLIYFYFSMEHKGVVGGVSKVGMWFLMICFGASFGYTVMGRMALFVGRVSFYVNDFLKLGG